MSEATLTQILKILFCPSRLWPFGLIWHLLSWPCFMFGLVSSKWHSPLWVCSWTLARTWAELVQTDCSWVRHKFCWIQLLLCPSLQTGRFVTLPTSWISGPMWHSQEPGAMAILMKRWSGEPTRLWSLAQGKPWSPRRTTAATLSWYSSICSAFCNWMLLLAWQLQHFQGDPLQRHVLHPKVFKSVCLSQWLSYFPLSHFAHSRPATRSFETMTIMVAMYGWCGNIHFCI